MWKKLVPELELLGLSAKAYGPALEGLCINYARAREAEAVLASEGLTVSFIRRDKNGNEISNYVAQRPEVGIANRCWAQVRLFCQEFGLSPSAATRIGSSKTEESLDDLLGCSDAEYKARFPNR